MDGDRDSVAVALPDDLVAWIEEVAGGRLSSRPTACRGGAQGGLVCRRRFLVREGDSGHILAGERTLTFEPETGWPLTLDLEAVDEFGRRLSVHGDVVSRHWRGHGGDSLVHWQWDGGLEGWGEDQSYFGRNQWEANRRRAAGT